MIQAVDYSTKIDDYCDAVAAGDVVACEAVQQAVARYRRDLERQSTDPDFPYLLEPSIAEMYCAFFPMVLRHSIGEWQGQPFKLSPWQLFIHWNVHGWRHREDGSRRFRKVLVSIGRKNGKTTYCAGASIQSAVADINPMTSRPEQVAEVCIGATKIDQAKIMFEEVVRMRNQSPAIAKASEVTQRVVRFPRTESVIKPLASDAPFSGLNPSSMLFDELHEFTNRHRKFFDTMTTGGGSRVQPLQWIISTASDDKGQIYHEEFDYARKVLADVIQDDRLFAIIFELDKDDDIFDEATWIKANPNLGVSVKMDYLRQQAREAKNKPAFKSSFERFHCNRCVKSVEQSVIPPVAELSDWADADAIGYGVDLGGMDDLASWAKVARFKIGERDEQPVYRYEATSRSALSQQTRRDLAAMPWAQWIAEGRLEVAQYVFTHLAQSLAADMDASSSQYFAYDPQFATKMAEDMHAQGFEPVKMTQRHYAFNEPMLELYAAIAEGRFVIDEQDAVLLWCFSNMALQRDAQGRIMPDKGSSKDKIDAAVAVVMALKAAMVIPPRTDGGLFIS